jgi:glycosyltransferase involved in cell wall biosynthesis
MPPGAGLTDRPTVVALWYELTPYHAHALARIHRELKEVRMVHVFTHSVKNNSMPWEVGLPDDVRIEFDERNRIPNEAFIHRRFLGTFRFLRSVIEREQPLFVLTAGHEDIARWMLIPYLRRRKVPYVLWADSNVHGLNKGRPVKDAIRWAYLRTIIRGFDAFMPMGSCGKAYYRVLGCGDKPMFLRPYEPDYGQVAARDLDAEVRLLKRFGLHPQRKRFLYSGRLVPWKRVDLLIKAFARVAESLPDWDLLIAGGGPLEAELRGMVPERLRTRVSFTGFLQMPDVRNCYHLSHVLVHPSQFEPWALVINESVAAGMAVIATDVTGAAVELVRHNVNGMLVSPGSQRELEMAMLRFADDARLQSMRAASARILGDWRSSADPIEGLRAAVGHFRSQPR